MTSNGSGERELWQTVLFLGVKDALEGLQIADPTRRKLDQVNADRWICRAGRDFRLVCSLAGVDPDFVRQAYTQGRIRLDLLVASETGNRREFARELQAYGPGGGILGRYREDLGPRSRRA